MHISHVTHHVTNRSKNKEYKNKQPFKSVIKKYSIKHYTRITDSFQAHIFDIMYLSNTTVARHLASHMKLTDPRMIIHILEYIMLQKDIPRPNLIRDKREFVKIHSLNTFIPNGQNVLD